MKNEICETIESILEVLIYCILAVSWIAGIAFSIKWISTLFSIIFPPYAWYLVVENIMQINGLI